MTTDPRKILIHRLGSLGDTLVTLPLFHLLDRRWPNAEKRVLTNTPVSEKAPTLWSILGDDNFIDGYFAYAPGMRNLGSLRSLIRQIRQWGPDLIIYANPLYSNYVRLRDRAFLGLCGSRKMMGIDRSNMLENPPSGDANGIVPGEAVSIFSGLSAIGDFDLDNPENWSLRLSDGERAKADRFLQGFEGADSFVAFSIGTKWPENDWGDSRWRQVFEILSARNPGLGLVALGAPSEGERSTGLMDVWQGPKLNCCGVVSPRESAAIIERARCFAGHDSGPMHLSAAVATPSVSIFSLKNPPGLWFPRGRKNRIFYPGLDWSGGDPVVKRDVRGESDISSIRPDTVAEACHDIIRSSESS